MSCLLAIWTNVFSSLSAILKSCYLFVVNLIELSFCVLIIHPLLERGFAKIVSHRMPFHFVDYALGYTNLFCFALFCCFIGLLMSDLIDLLLLENPFWLDSKLEIEALRKHSLCLLAICFWWVFFGLLHPLGQEFSMICSLFLIFLSVLFLQSNTPSFALEDMWSNKTQDLGSFCSRFLTVFV